jgi:hypothetical protein
MSKVPGSGSEPDEVEIIGYRGYQLCVQSAPGEWAVVIRGDGQSMLIVDTHREDAIARAQVWVDHQLAIGSSQ